MVSSSGSDALLRGCLVTCSHIVILCPVLYSVVRRQARASLRVCPVGLVAVIAVFPVANVVVAHARTHESPPRLATPDKLRSLLPPLSSPPSAALFS